MREKLPNEEYQKKYKDNVARQNKRKSEAKIYLKNNHPEKIICKVCNLFGHVFVHKITENTVRLRCRKCKNVRIIKVSLPKRFIPSR